MEREVCKGQSESGTTGWSVARCSGFWGFWDFWDFWDFLGLFLFPFLVAARRLGHCIVCPTMGVVTLRSVVVLTIGFRL